MQKLGKVMFRKMEDVKIFHVNISDMWNRLRDLKIYVHGRWNSQVESFFSFMLKCGGTGYGTSALREVDQRL